MLGITSDIDLTKVWDVAVIGGGPAGLTAAMYAARKNLSTILVTLDLGGQVGITHAITNYPGLPLVSGPDLVRLFFEQAYMYGLERMIGEQVTGIEIDGRAKVLKLTSGKEVKARAVIIASGAQKRKLDIAGEEEYAGHGVVYCSTCDGPFYRDATIAIVGGGNGALEAAIEMDGIARKVYLVSRGEWTGDAILQDKVNTSRRVVKLHNHEALEISGNDVVERLRVRDRGSGKERKLKVDGVFIEVGYFPNSSFVLDLLKTNEAGEVQVNEFGDTGVRPRPPRASPRDSYHFFGGSQLNELNTCCTSLLWQCGHSASCSRSCSRQSISKRF